MSPMMMSRFVLTVAAGLLAGTVAAAAELSEAPAGEKDWTGRSSAMPAGCDAPGDAVRPRRGTTGRGGAVAPRRSYGASKSLPRRVRQGAAPRQGEANRPPRISPAQMLE
jgi:hypothetical protein